MLPESPLKQRTVLGDIGNTPGANSPTKRKRMADSELDGERLVAPKRIRPYDEEKENTGFVVEIRAMGEQTGASPAKISPRREASHDGLQISASQQTLPDNPDSQDTIPDSQLPSSGSEQPDNHLLATPPATQRRQVGTTIDNKQLASNIKCRLQLAMYKLKSHKEDLSYKSLLPRTLISGKVAAPPTPPTRAAGPAILGSRLKTPAPVTSNISNERTLPNLMHRSSSNDASISETPIRRNYGLNTGLSSPPDSRESLPHYTDIKLPGINDSHKSKIPIGFTLPPISALGTLPQQL